MIQNRLISLAAVAATLLVVAPAAALSLVPPIDCQDGETVYELTEAMPGGLIYTRAYTTGDDEAVEWLLSCAAGKGVRSLDSAKLTMAFHEVAVQLEASDETYSFEDVAKLSRELGFDATVTGFSKSSCICKGDW